LCLTALALATATPSQAQTFTNTTNIRIPASGSGPGPSSPYPSTIVVAGLTQPIGAVTVNITGLSHTFPADIGILLVGPTGQSVVLMSNTGANCDVNGINLRFADGAPPLSPDCILSGTYSPTTLGAPTFDPPATQPPNGSALSLFSGTSGNGTWSLFVFDDAFLDSGSIAGGWSITFTPTPVTYQGKLERSLGAITGNADFVFSVFASPTGGTAMATVAQNNVPVTNNLFTVELPLSSALFDSTPRWLEIAVRSPAGSGFFNILSPRQPLDATPLALYARTAGFATAALSAVNATRAQSAVAASIATHATSADSADTATTAETASTADLATAATRLDAPDGSPTGAVVVSNGGDVGIPIATVGNKLSVFGNFHVAGNTALGPNLLSAQSLLHVSGGTSGATAQPEAQLFVEGFDSAFINIATRDSLQHGLTFGSPASSIHGGVYYTNSVGMDFRTGNNLSRLTINSAGNVGIGVGVSGGSIDAKLHVSNAGRAAKFDRAGTDGELVAFSRDDGVVGNITVAGGVVSYNAFTGSHWAWIDSAPERGMLVSMTGDNRRAGRHAGEGEVIYGVALATAANDPACLGAYLAPVESSSADFPQPCHQVMAVGNGEMWVVDTGRDIHPGDYLISSDTPGCAMLDDPSRFPIGNVIARAAEAVHWDNAASPAGPRRRISVLFGSFARAQPTDSTPTCDSLRSALQSLATENAALKERLDHIEKQLARSALAR
jgi:subtilisin-like proprotein convertase family protein